MSPKQTLIAQVVLIWTNDDARNIIPGLTGFHAEANIVVSEKRLRRAGMTKLEISELPQAMDPSEKVSAGVWLELQDDLLAHFPGNVLTATISDMSTPDDLHLQRLRWRYS